jgi:O-antigen ligase
MTSGFNASPKKNSIRSRKLDTSTQLSLTCLASLCLLLMGAVLAFGAQDIWAVSILEMGSVLLLSGWGASHIRADNPRVKWNPLYPPVLAFAFIVSIQIALNLTVYRYETIVMALRYTAFAALILLVVQITGDDRSSKILLFAFACFGFAVSAFAICQDLGAHGKLYWVLSTPSGSPVFGPYVNRDHYAGLMEMLTPPALVLSLSKLLRKEQRILAAFGAVLMSGSIVLSGSRAGTFSLIIELIFLFFVASQARKQSRSQYILLVIGCCAIGFLGWVGSQELWHRFRDLREVIRPTILKDSLQMFRAKPIFGWGLGTFSTAYPTFRSFYTDLFVNAAHNDYLQTLVETGILGFASALWFVTVLYRQGLKQIIHWTDNWNSALRVATLTGCTGLLVHSAFDFNLQIPANAAYFYVFCAISTNLPTPVHGRFIASTPS